MKNAISVIYPGALPLYRTSEMLQQSFSILEIANRLKILNAGIKTNKIKSESIIHLN